MNRLLDKVKQIKIKEWFDKVKDFFSRVCIKYKSLSKKWKIMIGIIIAIVVVIIVIVTSILIYNKMDAAMLAKKSDNERFSLEYERLNERTTLSFKKYPQVNISESNIFKYIDVAKVNEIMENNGEAVVYFGSPKCLYCRSAVQVLHDVAKETKLDVIYYVDVTKEKKEVIKLYEKFDERLIFSDDDVSNLLKDSLVVFIADGFVVSYQEGTLFSQESPYDPLDEWQLYGLKEIYLSGINDVLRSIQNKKEAASKN